MRSSECRAHVGGLRSATRPAASCPRNGDGYLVDPASSDMLVSKIKPCRCKYELT